MTLVTNILAPELRLVDQDGRPFSLREALAQQAATALYTFRGHW